MKKMVSFLLSLALMAGLCLPALANEGQDWVIFVYLCGTDLESEGGAATADLIEMMEAGAGGAAGRVADSSVGRVGGGVFSRRILPASCAGSVEAPAVRVMTAIPRSTRRDGRIVLFCMAILPTGLAP